MKATKQLGEATMNGIWANGNSPPAECTSKLHILKKERKYNYMHEMCNKQIFCCFRWEFQDIKKFETTKVSAFNSQKRTVVCDMIWVVHCIWATGVHVESNNGIVIYPLEACSSL